jgi:hypothetical protein
VPDVVLSEDLTNEVHVPLRPYLFVDAGDRRLACASMLSPDARSCRHTAFIDVWDFSVGASRERLDEGLEPAV